MQLRPAKMQPLDWNDIRAFLAVAQAGQIGRAAARLAIDPTTLGRRIRRLEGLLEVVLFERTSDGQALTEAGEALLAKAEGMAEAARGIGEDIAPHAGVSGNLRISVSEGFGTRFLTPFVGDLVARHPNLTIDLIANSGFLSPSKREADIAVMLSRPTAGPVISRKLSDYRLRLYASRGYLDRNGMPATTADLARGHALIGYVPDLVYAPELNYLAEIEPGLVATMRSSSINAQMRLIAEGSGVGVLPHFMACADDDLVAICPERTITRSFWIVTHKDTHRLARVKAGRDWLERSIAAGQDRLFPAS